MIDDMRKDRRGGLEGLPLQLMITIMVATLGTAIIIGWMGNIETPHSIGDINVSEDNLDGTSGTLGDFTITVRDQDGEYLKGATVVLRGLNVTDAEGKTAYAVTDESGKAKFSGLKIDPSGNGAVGFLAVSVSLAGYGEDSTTRITVIL